MQIFLQMPDGKTIVKQVDYSTPVSSLFEGKQKMTLSKGGVPVCTHQAIGDANISDGDTLSMCPALPGGGCSCSCRCNIL